MTVAPKALTAVHIPRIPTLFFTLLFTTFFTLYFTYHKREQLREQPS